MSVPSLARFKWCTQCGVLFPAHRNFFFFRANGKPNSPCRICKRRADRRFYQRHSEKIKDYQRRYGQENKEKIAAQKRRYQQGNREQRNAYKKQWYWDNAERLRERQNERFREWAKTPEGRAKIAHYNKLGYERRKHDPYWQEVKRIDNLRRLNRLRDAEGQHTAEELRQMVSDQGGLCAYCETPMGDEWSVEHMVPISRGGSDWAENIAITCRACNYSKNDKTAEEYFAWLGYSVQLA